MHQEARFVELISFRFFCHPLFLIGLAIRLALIILVVPHAASHWYVPFLENSIHHLPNLDPWSNFLHQGGTPLAFPYGIVMWLAFLPLVSLFMLIGAPVFMAYALTLLAADIGLLVVLKRLTYAPSNYLLALYWLSPIALFATYYLGFNDIIPILLLSLALLKVDQNQMARAGIFVAAAIATKFSMALAVPFLSIYLIHNKRLRFLLPRFLAGFGIGFLVLVGTWLLSPGARFMLMHNPEIDRLYNIAFPFGTTLYVYFLPLAYTLALFAAWRVKRMGFDLLLTLLGIAFFLVLLLSPAAPGWFVWVLPFLVIYQINSGRVAIGLVTLFSFLYLGLNILLIPLPALPFDERFLSLWQTLLLATGLIIAARMVREGVQSNEYFRLSRKPFVIGIAGDSGSGKDTLSESLTELFGKHSVTQISGDNYHLWDRQKPMWQVMTHLNPRANDLAQLSEDIRTLMNGRTVHARYYDHTHGRMSKPLPIYSNDFIIASGLHMLYMPALRNMCELRIFLDMDEDLRKHLKIQRDVTERGHTLQKVEESFIRREPDSERFIQPQRTHATLIFSLQPIHEQTLNDPQAPLRLKLCVQMLQGMYDEKLIRALIGICGLYVEILESKEDMLELIIEGETSGEDVALAARELLPHLRELLAIDVVWREGMNGVMQLITLTQIVQSLRKRLV